jgi:hypothetical protein
MERARADAMWRGMRRAALALGAGAGMAGCAGGPPRAGLTDAPEGEALTVFSADDALTRDWQLFRVWRTAEFGLAALDGAVAIRAYADGASAGLGRWIDIDTDACPTLEWTWRVDRLPPAADLTSKQAEDVAASVMVLFGDPGSLSLPKPVPTLRYVWATQTQAVGSLVDSPYLPGTLRSIVVRSGAEGLGRPVAERRDLTEDYEAAFGRPPPEPVRLVALFTDSDHGTGPVEAFYLGARALCRDGGAGALLSDAGP